MNNAFSAKWGVSILNWGKGVYPVTHSNPIYIRVGACMRSTEKCFFGVFPYAAMRFLCVRPLRLRPYVRYARLRGVSGLGVLSSVGWLFRGGFRRIQSELRADFLCVKELRSLAVQCISFRPSVRNIVAQNGKTGWGLFF